MRSICTGLLIVVLAASFAGAQTGPSQVGYTLLPLSFSVQKPWNLALASRYSFDSRTNIHHCWVFNTDQPLAQGNTTDPRTEMRFPDYTNSTRYWQYAADYLVPAGTNNVCIFQIHVGDSESDADGSTSFMIFVSGGNICHYSGTVMMTKPYGKWFHLNVIHDTQAGLFYCYINNAAVPGSPYSDNANGQEDDWYFKCGVYGQSGQSTLTQSYVRNPQIWYQN